MSDATIGWGTKLLRGNGATPEVFTALAEVVSIDPPDESTDEAECSHLNSPGRFREFLLTMTDPGEVVFTVNHLPGNAGHQALRTDKTNLTMRNFEIEFYEDDGTTLLETCAFSAQVRNYKVNTIEKDVVKTAEVTLRLSGAITWS